jgi:hypothetical protein
MDRKGKWYRKKVINCTVSQSTEVSPGLKIIYIYIKTK